MQRAQRCRDTAFSKIGEAKTEANGTWTFATKPLDRTNFRAQRRSIDPTEISGRNFRSSIRAGKRVRMRMDQPVAGTCYLASSSNVIFS